MHIAFLILKLCSGGAERSTTSLANQMAATGHKVTILALTEDTSFYPTENVDVRFLKMEELPSAKGIARLRGTVRRALKLRKIVKELNPDVLVGMSHIMSGYAAFCTKGTKIKSVGTERANPFVLYAGTAMNLFRKTASLFCDGFVCQTRKARSFFPKPVQKKAAVIPNAIFNPMVFNTSVPKERKCTITALGRLDANKGFDVLLNAFAQVHALHPECTVTIFGEGPERENLEKQVKKLGLSDFVSLPGVRPDAIYTIAESSVFVLSSRSEGMPNALIEALASGVPCVSTNCDMGPDELIVNENNGILVPVDDVDAMANAICRILQSQSLSDALSMNAIKIRETHCIDEICKRWTDYFGTL